MLTSQALQEQQAQHHLANHAREVQDAGVMYNGREHHYGAAAYDVQQYGAVPLQADDVRALGAGNPHDAYAQEQYAAPIEAPYVQQERYQEPYAQYAFDGGAGVEAGEADS